MKGLDMNRYFRITKGTEIDTKLVSIFDMLQAHSDWIIQVTKELGFEEAYVKKIGNLTNSLIGFVSEFKPDGYKKIKNIKGVDIYYPKVSNKSAIKKLENHPPEVAIKELNDAVGFRSHFADEGTRVAFVKHPKVTLINDIFYIIMEAPDEFVPKKGMVEIKEWEFLKTKDLK